MSGLFIPAVRATLPEGWFAKESTTLLAGDGQANVIASSEPLDPSIDPYSYAEVQGDLLRTEFNEYHEFDFGPHLIFGGRPGYIRDFSWRPPDGVEVRQIQLYYAEGGRGYTATGTTPSSEFSRFEEQLRGCLHGIRLEFQA